MAKHDRMLVVDADARVRDFFVEIAQSADFQVATACNEQEISARLNLFDPGVVLLGFDGNVRESTMMLRKISDADGSPKVVLLSGLRDRQAVCVSHMGVLLGLDMKGFIQRPIAKEVIREQLDELCRALN